MIPYRRFYALLVAMGPVAAAEQFRQYYATALGVANAMASSDEAKSAVNDAIERLRRDACPTVPALTSRRAADE